jgi:hypothetical protein
MAPGATRPPTLRNRRSNAPVPRAPRNVPQPDPKVAPRRVPRGSASIRARVLVAVGPKAPGWIPSRRPRRRTAEQRTSVGRRRVPLAHDPRQARDRIEVPASAVRLWRPPMPSPLDAGTPLRRPEAVRGPKSVRVSRFGRLPGFRRRCPVDVNDFKEPSCAAQGCVVFPTSPPNCASKLGVISGSVNAENHPQKSSTGACG